MFHQARPAETIDGSYLIAVEDIDDNKREDFLLLPAEGGVTTKALVNTGTSFSLVAGFVPPIEFAREEKVGASPQFVDLNADGLTDVVGYHLDKAVTQSSAPRRLTQRMAGLVSKTSTYLTRSR